MKLEILLTLYQFTPANAMGGVASDRRASLHHLFQVRDIESQRPCFHTIMKKPPIGVEHRIPRTEERLISFNYLR